MGRLSGAELRRFFHGAAELGRLCHAFRNTVAAPAAYDGG